MSKVNKGVAAAIILSGIAVLFSGLALLFAAGLLGAERPAPPNFEAQARQYLLQKPEIVAEALQRLEERRQAAATNEFEAIIVERREEIFNDPTAPVGGNPQGDVTLVEFFDYNCPYCRKAAAILQQAMTGDSGLKLVFKEWPILGPGSEFAAKAALASHKQGKYEVFHKALMSHSGAAGEKSTLIVAKEVGLDIERLQQDMQDPAIAAGIERNRALANDLRIAGTPTFVVGDQIVRGLVDLATLQQFIVNAREKPKD
ncbi:Disulfide bond formation protein D [Ensifer sp. M14]|uniref:Thioredoxin domain-containing protein n=1 Tax=Sinorhizobium sp. M14 TaxID=430451 RepID=A0A142BPP2_9HYPH|nr:MULTISPECIES: DsbA family protein [Sinorhizobium/Ensifer group]AMP35050.1 hypothetical protein pSinB_191 [Sinorhizobium sp. M14]RDL48028.1 Disulfide bond formation protein D [Ensifer sp. M14]